MENVVQNDKNLKEGSSLKIALLCDHFIPRIGGIELHVRDLAKELAKKGYNVHVLTTTPGETLVEGIPILRFKASLLPGVKIIWNFKALRALKKKLVTEKYDLLHVHSSVVSPFAYGAITLAAKMGIPCLVTCHSLLEFSRLPLRVLSKILAWKKDHIRISAVSSYATELFQKSLNFNNAYVLANGTDPLFLEPVMKQKGELKLVSVLRFNRKKMVHKWVEILPKLLSRHQGSKLSVVLIGDGPYRKKIERMIRIRNLESSVCLRGYMDREKIMSELAEADLFVLPTKKESFGLSLLEARKAKLPILAMNYGGTSDIVTHGQEGYLAKNYDQLLDFALLLCSDDQLRQKMSNKSHLGLDKFFWENIVQEHEKVYQEFFS